MLLSFIINKIEFKNYNIKNSIKYMKTSKIQNGTKSNKNNSEENLNRKR